MGWLLSICYTVYGWGGSLDPVLSLSDATLSSGCWGTFNDVLSFSLPLPPLESPSHICLVLPIVVLFAFYFFCLQFFLLTITKYLIMGRLTALSEETKPHAKQKDILVRCEQTETQNIGYCYVQ